MSINPSKTAGRGLFFPVHYFYAVLICLYLFSFGLLRRRNRDMILEICRHFNFFKVPRMLRQQARFSAQNPELRKRLENEQFCRYCMYIDISDFVRNEMRNPEFKNCKAIELGGSNEIIKLMFEGCSYEIADNFPKVDVCDLSGFRPDHYDYVILDQVLEHVADPAKAMNEVHRILKKGGYLIVTTPFLVKVHYVPKDYWRFTQDGLRQLLLRYSHVTVKSWGNKDVIMDHIRTTSWPLVKEVRRFGLLNLENDEELPHSVWAFARK